MWLVKPVSIVAALVLVPLKTTSQEEVGRAFPDQFKVVDQLLPEPSPVQRQVLLATAVIAMVWSALTLVKPV